MTGDVSWWRGRSAPAGGSPVLRVPVLLAACLSALAPGRAALADDPARPSDGRARGLAAFVAVDVGSVGETSLAAENADLLLQPASVQKAIVAACALDILGAGHRVTTRLTATDAPDDAGTVAGDLVLHGGGDPTWSTRFSASADAPLDRLAADAARHGLRVVQGDLVLDVSLFPPPDEPRSRSLAEMALGWGASVSALAIDENILRLRIAPGARVGAPPRAEWLGRPLALPELVMRATTAPRDRHDLGTMTFRPIWDRGALFIAGEYPISEPSYDVPVAMPDPLRQVSARLRAALARHGVAVRGGDRVERFATPRQRAEPIAVWRSPSLARWLEPILEDSHNWLAEMLLRQLAVAATGSGRLEDGLAALATCLETAGAAPSDFVLDDGSGLSGENLITARAVARLLAWAWSRPWRAAFVGALARPGEGTLRGWPALPALAAKTGTKRHTQALAGYLGPASERPVVFVALLDHRTDGNAERRAEIARRVARLAAWQNRRHQEVP